MDTILDLYYRVRSGELRFYFLLPAVLFASFPAIVWVYIIYQRKKRWRIRYPITNALAKIPQVRRVGKFSRHVPMLARLVVLALVIVASMRPQMGKSHETVKTKGVDIMLCLDISPSMLAEDFKPNRAEAAKKVLIDFVRRNQNDRIGLVVFSGMAFTQCPMTTDTAILEEFISQVQVGDVLQDGTAIGDAIVTTVARFPDQEVASKVIILTTDGEHNLGRFDPQTAARIARRMGVKIYTIGVGSDRGVPIPDPTRPGQYMIDFYGRVATTKLDEATLRDVANLTGGRYYRATDETALARIYEEIGKLETHEIESRRFVVYSEVYQYVLGAALLFLLFELISRLMWGRVLP